ncbi:MULTISPECIES: peptide-methionine (S)-S-oxide reductase MsrA [unclassified Mucilaginibacter]|uniref:peptide-methionine (S)-S-oxide reductase MsrA n=1 Tax=unclassified Mucilaginibacter TaxID=2617802 RepID=UPI002AC8AC83|nr:MULTISPECIES: peptide-methionine (S)-S-oxide reductase MsrA [unclassified Mucilaginibacter]MEB0261864.1 peptide-methionine (S)-S-oxide reductase MsrA [Mucilaginibacter sp. 10I4]MEB0278915.1 peptide-methionine (S)-S-oxide reductase MsrA [Mucilaginibacter sp. 10B2]MEB0302882.1 peptide-methionine (S)-S-oxide reductase MsrA [Mucilaginibacter sp. 5C4]WPX22097.1 peptide-methionine (S)-S-oxide reductase MsrA [Mucilaginibacter sp. 5C4]
MKIAIIYLASVMLFFGCANGQTGNRNAMAPVPKSAVGEAVATFGGGCFWSMSEAMIELKGVSKVVSGYAGGKTKNPTYEEVSDRTTGHAEVTQIYYNPKEISFATLAEAFFFAHDPTTLNRQGPDVGTDYRSIAFYRTPEEKETLISVIKKVNDTKHYTNPIVTQVVPFSAFYAAENYHQGYYRTNGDNPYISSVSEPKVMKFRKAMKAELKQEFLK